MITTIRNQRVTVHCYPSVVPLSCSNRLIENYIFFVPGRFSREAEFLSRTTTQPAAYEHFGCDVRYTADGYPVRMDDSPQAIVVPSPAESHKSISSTSTTEPCCSTAAAAVAKAVQIRPYGQGRPLDCSESR